MLERQVVIIGLLFECLHRAYCCFLKKRKQNIKWPINGANARLEVLPNLVIKLRPAKIFASFSICIRDNYNKNYDYKRTCRKSNICLKNVLKELLMLRGFVSEFGTEYLIFFFLFLSNTKV